MNLKIEGYTIKQYMHYQRSDDFRKGQHGIIWNADNEEEEIKLAPGQQFDLVQRQILEGMEWISEIK